MDFFLPDSSRVLLCRIRIVNDNPRTIPMYWWSNIAIPEVEGGRVIMDTEETYTNKTGGLTKCAVPIVEGNDITYPMNNPTSIDFFWKLPEDARRYECQLDREGYGLVQTSTRRLKGRKLFVWGQGPGGDRWQSYLTEGNDGRYVEIQAGLGCTQMECLPMPPKTAWEWVEAYGAMSANPEKVHGDWIDARDEVGKRLEELIGEAELEKILRETKDMAKSPAEKTVFHGGGYGALENLRREAKGEKLTCPHLDFREVEEEQAAWVRLLRESTLGEHDETEAPKSYMNQPEWIELLEKSVLDKDAGNWYSRLQLGMYYLSEMRTGEARTELERSLVLNPSPWALWGLAQLEGLQGDRDARARIIMRASKMIPSDLALARDCARVLLEEKMHREILSYTEKLPEKVKNDGRLLFCRARALAELDMAEEAEEILYRDGGLQIPDVREGEISLSELFYLIEEKKAALKGQSFDSESVDPPAFLDFRMSAKRRK